MISMLFLAAAASAASVPASKPGAIESKDWQAVHRTSTRLGVPTITLFRAMSEPEAPRREAETVRLCIRRDDIVAGKTGTVCRTRRQWEGFGLEIDSPEG